MTNLGERVKELRERMGWNQKEAAEKAGLHPTHIGLIEKNARTGTRPETLGKLASAFGVSVAYLIGEEAPSDDGAYHQAILAAKSAGMSPGDLLKLIDTVAAIRVNK